MTASVSADMTRGSIAARLVGMTLPMIAGFLAVITFEFADGWFVSRLGTPALAALSFSFPVCLTIICLFVGLGIGTGSAVSRAVGRGDAAAARRLATSSLLFSLVVSALISAAGILTVRPLFRFLGAGEELLAGIEAYMTVWYAGVFTVAVPVIAGNALLAVGAARATGLINTFGSVANIVFDPLFIFGWGIFPRWGLAGAAAATVAARFAASLLSLAVLSFRHRLFAPRIRPFSRLLADWRPTAAVGFPAAATHMVGPLALALLIRLASRFGIEAVAAVGVGSRIDPFIFVVFWSLSDVMVVFTGQNLGAGRVSRIAAATSVSMAFVLGWGLASAVLLYLLGAGIGRNFSAFFNNDIAFFIF
ncbi:MAG TPA: MATE family efflux transporter [bacterium]|nr:MATE family efflux transporter [bacterium]